MEVIPVGDIRRVIAVDTGAGLADGLLRDDRCPGAAVNSLTASALPSSTTIHSRCRCSEKTRSNSTLSWKMWRKSGWSYFCDSWFETGWVMYVARSPAIQDREVVVDVVLEADVAEAGLPQHVHDDRGRPLAVLRRRLLRALEDRSDVDAAGASGEIAKAGREAEALRRHAYSGIGDAGVPDSLDGVTAADLDAPAPASSTRSAPVARISHARSAHNAASLALPEGTLVGHARRCVRPRVRRGRPDPRRRPASPSPTPRSSHRTARRCWASPPGFRPVMRLTGTVLSREVAADRGGRVVRLHPSRAAGHVGRPRGRRLRAGHRAVARQPGRPSRSRGSGIRSSDASRWTCASSTSARRRSSAASEVVFFGDPDAGEPSLAEWVDGDRAHGSRARRPPSACALSGSTSRDARAARRPRRLRCEPGAHPRRGRARRAHARREGRRVRPRAAADHRARVGGRHPLVRRVRRADRRRRPRRARRRRADLRVACRLRRGDPHRDRSRTRSRRRRRSTCSRTSRAARARCRARRACTSRSTPGFIATASDPRTGRPPSSSAAAHEASGTIDVVGVWSHLAEASDAEDDAAATQFLDGRRRRSTAPDSSRGASPRRQRGVVRAPGVPPRPGAGRRVRVRHQAGRRSRTRRVLGIRPIATLAAPVVRIDDEGVHIAVGALHGLPSTLAGRVSVGEPGGTARAAARSGALRERGRSAGPKRWSVTRW